MGGQKTNAGQGLKDKESQSVTLMRLQHPHSSPAADRVGTRGGQFQKGLRGGPLGGESKYSWQCSKLYD